MTQRPDYVQVQSDTINNIVYALILQDLFIYIGDNGIKAEDVFPRPAPTTRMPPCAMKQTATSVQTGKAWKARLGIVS